MPVDRKWAITHLTGRRFGFHWPPKLATPEELQYKTELAAQADAALLDLIVACESARPDADQVSTILLRIFDYQEVIRPQGRPISRRVEAWREHLGALNRDERLAILRSVANGDVPSDEQLTAKAYPYNRANSTPRYQHWAIQDYWRPEEVISLSLDKDPSVVNFDSINGINTVWVAGWLDRQVTIVRAVEVANAEMRLGKIPVNGLSDWRPRTWIKWGEPRGIAFPPKLIEKLPPDSSTTAQHESRGWATAVIPAVPVIEPMAQHPEAQESQADEGDKYRELYTPRVPEPKLEFLSWEGLAETFKSATGKKSKEEAEWWRYAASQRTKNRLLYVEQANTKPVRYNPEGVALWLHYEQHAKLADVARAMIRLCDKFGSAWEPKADYWQRVLDQATPDPTP